MPATREQKLKARLLLEAPRYEAEDVDAAVEALDETELAELERILTEAADAELSTMRVSAEGVTLDPAEARAHMRRRLADLIGWDDDPSNVVIGR